MERVTREVMFKQERYGGRGMPDVRLFVTAHLLVFLMRGLHNKLGLTSAFLQYYWGRFFHLKGWYKMVFTQPYTDNIPNVFKFFLKSFQHYSFAEITNAFNTVPTTGKSFVQYVRLKDDTSPVANFPNQVADSLWQRACSKSLYAKHIDINWQCMHKILPVKEFQYHRRLARDDKCFRRTCDHTETQTHFLWSCRYATKFWKKLSFFFAMIVPGIVLTHEAVMYGLFPAANNVQENILNRMFTAARFTLWQVRIIYTRNNDYIDGDGATRLFLANVYWYYLLDVRALGQIEALSIWHKDRWKHWRRNWAP